MKSESLKLARLNKIALAVEVYDLSSFVINLRDAKGVGA
jgi:hypothetical protein